MERNPLRFERASRRWPAALAVLAFAACGFALPHAQAERIKDIASIQGVRPNQLLGYGLVVGLDGSGDQTTQTPFTVQSLQTMLAQLGVTLPPGSNLQLKNAAAVMVTAMLPAFSKPGQLLDVTVSSLGNAKSLRGGTLLLTPLKGADGRIYAMAQGNVVIAGAGASAAGSKVQINQLNSGRIPAGATVEQAVLSPLLESDTIDLELHASDFGNARRVAEAINASLGGHRANALDGRVVRVKAPFDPNERIGFLARLEELNVDTGLPPARVIINARTGSIVMNSAVTLEPCAVAHGNLSITITTTPVISQPNPLSGGQTVVAEKADIQIKQDGGNVMLLEAGAKLADVVKALNVLGATPQDLLSILQAMKAAGALRAELEVI
jgi:flagellar P-ring protein precursor FlgI